MRMRLRLFLRAMLLTVASAVPPMAFAQSAAIDVAPPGTAAAGSTVTVKWSGPNGPGDYITVVPSGAGPFQYLDYKQTSNGRAPVNPVLLVLPAEPGAYEIRYVSGNPRRVLATVPYEVTSVAASIEGPATIAPGARFEIAWMGPDNHGDWVTIVAPDAAVRVYGSYIDVRSGRADEKTGRRSATLLAPVKPGRYELRYVQQGRLVIGTRTIDVSTGGTSAAIATRTETPTLEPRAGATATATLPRVIGQPTSPGPGKPAAPALPAPRTISLAGFTAAGAADARSDDP